uniref:Trans-2,3-enoyl-CoA reductase n=1 Tax=Canis lupus familiaris TaxID=9615 RepID=A0A8C0T1R2_CANLF
MDLNMSMVAREASQGLGPGPSLGLNGLPRIAPAKATKKPKKAVLFFEVEILDAKTREKLCFLDKVEPHATIAEIKNLFTKTQGKSLKDEDILQKLPVGTTATLYFRDLGAQISWVTVFLTEYAGPLFIYLLFYFRVPFIYGHKYDFTSSRHSVVHLACICHSFHYVKRLLETLFVHRFSHGTMPLRNIFKNCTYYWGFAAWMAYYINHPLYTPPTYGAQQVKLALAIFVICQLGNFSIHMALRDLRPAGSKTRKIPYPTKNPFTWLFLLVSCPNYTYEVGSWIGFAIMTQCLPGQDVGEAVTLALEQPDEVVGTVVSLLEHQLCVVHLLLCGHHLCREWVGLLGLNCQRSVAHPQHLIPGRPSRCCATGSHGSGAPTGTWGLGYGHPDSVLS